MEKFYLLFIVIGLIGLICVLVFGVKGMYSLNLAFLLFFLKRRNYDERETALAQRALYMTMGIVIIILINIYVLNQFIAFSEHLRIIWVGLLISLAFIIHGIFGIVIFKNN